MIQTESRFHESPCGPQTEKIIGAAIRGEDRGEVMVMIQVAMKGKLKYTALQNAILRILPCPSL